MYSGAVQKKKFEEERARRILLHFFPEKYICCELSESPDIISIDKSIGVEVTASFVSQLQERASWASKISGKTENQLSKADCQHIEKGHITAKQIPDGRYLAAFSMWGNTHDIVGAFRRKTDKLNSAHFTKCNENNLFIFALMIDDNELLSGINELLASADKKEASSNGIWFNEVYIFDEHKLIAIDISSQQILTHSIEREDMTCISHSAFFEVFGMTRDEYYHMVTSK